MALLEIQSPNGLCLKQQQNRPEYSGRPNIGGTFGIRRYVDFYDMTGALTATDGSARSTGVQSDSIEESNRKIVLDASQSNSIFGSSDTVQPKGMYVQCLIRYAA